MPIDPQTRLRAWLPHLAMLALFALALWLVAAVFAPIRDPLLLAAALAMLSYSVLFRPLLMAARWLLPGVAESWRRHLAAGAATIALVVALLAPLALLLLASLRSLSEAGTLLLGLALRDERQLARLGSLVRQYAEATVALYPSLPLDPAATERFVAGLFGQSQSSALLNFVFTGTGSFLAEMVLALVLLGWFYDQGPVLVRTLLGYTPLEPAQRSELSRRLEAAVVRMWLDTVARALVRGVTTGVFVWLVADLNPILIGMVAAFVSLIPLVGLAFVWVPLASLLWAQAMPWHAGGLVLGVLAADFLVCELGTRVTRGLAHTGEWFSLLLFLSLTGGLLAFGAKGLVIGPMAVVVLVVLGSFWLPLYGIGKALGPDGLPAEAGAAPPAAKPPAQVPADHAIVPQGPGSKVHSPMAERPE